MKKLKTQWKTKNSMKKLNTQEKTQGFDNLYSHFLLILKKWLKTQKLGKRRQNSGKSVKSSCNKLKTQAKNLKVLAKSLGRVVKNRSKLEACLSTSSDLLPTLLFGKFINFYCLWFMTSIVEFPFLFIAHEVQTKN